MAEKRKVYHVSKRESDGMWAIHIQGSDTVIKLFSTKAEAETYCQTLGANQQGTILFHNSKGKAKGSISTTQVHKKEAAKAETKVAKPVIAAKPKLKPRHRRRSLRPLNRRPKWLKRNNEQTTNSSWMAGQEFTFHGDCPFCCHRSLRNSFGLCQRDGSH